VAVTETVQEMEAEIKVLKPQLDELIAQGMDIHDDPFFKVWSKIYRYEQAMREINDKQANPTGRKGY